MGVGIKDVRKQAATLGWCDVTVQRTDTGFWKASARKAGLQYWLETGGSTRKSAIANLLKSLEGESLV